MSNGWQAEWGAEGGCRGGGGGGGGYHPGSLLHSGISAVEI